MIYLKCATNDHLTDYAAPRNVCASLVLHFLLSHTLTHLTASVGYLLRFVSLICKIYLIL